MDRNEQGDPGDAGDAGGFDDPGELCERCGVPLPEPRRTACVLGEGCCDDCFAMCEAAGRCAKFPDAFWERVERLRRLAYEPAVHLEKKG